MTERVEVDSVVDLQLPVDDNLQLGAAADELAAEGEYLDVSDTFDAVSAIDQRSPPGDIAGDIGDIEDIARSLDSRSVVQGTPPSEGILSNLSGRILPSWLGWSDRRPAGQAPHNPSTARSLSPGRSTPGREVVRTNVSAVSGPQQGPSGTGRPLRGPPVSGSMASASGAVRPGSVGPCRDQVDQRAGNVPSVASGSLFGQPQTAVVATTDRTVRYVNPIDASTVVQGSWLVGAPSQVASIPSVPQSVPMVSQVAMPPVQVIVSVAGSSLPAYVTWVDGIGYVPPSTVLLDPRSVTLVTSSVNSVMPVTPSVTSVAYSVTAVTSVPQPVTSVTSSVTSVPSLMSIQSNPSFPSMPSGVTQISQGPSGPGAVGAMSTEVGNVGQVINGTFVPASTGYNGPWGWSARAPMPIGPVGAYGWVSGNPPPVDPSGTAGWATGLPEQARGTTVTTQHLNPISRTMLNYVAGQNTVPMPVLGGTSNATGAPVQSVRPPDIVSVAGGNYVPPSAGPIGPSGWPLGVPLL